MLAGCQAAPQPFINQGKRPAGEFLALADPGGIVIGGIEGLSPDRADALADALSEKLAEREIPAFLGNGNQRSFFLQGRGSERRTAGGGSDITIEWTLMDPDATTVGTAKAAGLVARDGSGMTRLAGNSAALLAKLIYGTSDGAPADLTRRPLHVSAVSGTDRQRGAALRRGLEFALRNAGLKVGNERAKDGLVIAGRLGIGAPVKGLQQVEIVWSLRGPSGREIGTLAQRNAVPEAQIQRHWNELAAVIARNAVPGVLDLLQRAPRQASLPLGRDSS